MGVHPKHVGALQRIILKYGILSREQVFTIFAGRLCLSAVHLCLARLFKEKFIQRVAGLSERGTVYILGSKAPTASAKLYRTTDLTRRLKLEHRLSCNDVSLSLARRSCVKAIALEHETVAIPESNLVQDHRPDGYFTLQKGELFPSDIAIEVELSLQNRDRIRSVIDCYRQTFRHTPQKLAGVLIVAATETIANAYRRELAEVSPEVTRRFVISESFALTDVSESALGDRLGSVLDHPCLPVEKAWVPAYLESNLCEISGFRRNTGDIDKNHTAV